MLVKRYKNLVYDPRDVQRIRNEKGSFTQADLYQIAKRWERRSPIQSIPLEEQDYDLVWVRE
jgi:hypothetical protein